MQMEGGPREGWTRTESIRHAMGLCASQTAASAQIQTEKLGGGVERIGVNRHRNGLKLNKLVWNTEVVTQQVKIFRPNQSQHGRVGDSRKPAHVQNFGTTLRSTVSSNERCEQQSEGHKSESAVCRFNLPSPATRSISKRSSVGCGLCENAESDVGAPRSMTQFGTRKV